MKFTLVQGLLVLASISFTVSGLPQFPGFPLNIGQPQAPLAFRGLPVSQIDDGQVQIPAVTGLPVPAPVPSSPGQVSQIPDGQLQAPPPGQTPPSAPLGQPITSIADGQLQAPPATKIIPGSSVGFQLDGQPTVAATHKAPHKRSNAGVYVCSDPHFSGNCVYYSEPTGTDHCTTLDGTASSVGPDQGFTCTFFRNGFCDVLSDSPLTLEYPGNDNLAAIGWEDAIYSYACYPL